MYFIISMCMYMYLADNNHLKTIRESSPIIMISESLEPGRQKLSFSGEWMK